jgi:hypothetical protein
LTGYRIFDYGFDLGFGCGDCDLCFDSFRGFCFYLDCDFYSDSYFCLCYDFARDFYFYFVLDLIRAYFPHFDPRHRFLVPLMDFRLVFEFRLVQLSAIWNA